MNIHISLGKITIILTAVHWYELEWVDAGWRK